MEKECSSKLMEKWLQNNNKELALSSSVKYRQLFYRHIDPFFRGIPIGDISEKMLENYKDNILAKNRKEGEERLSNENIKCIAMLINHFLLSAYKENIINEKLHIDIRLKKKRNEIHVFSDNEQEKLEKYLWDNMDLSAGGIILCLYTGLRIGELCALKWSDMDMTENLLSVSRTVQRLKTDSSTSLFISMPKTESSIRTIPITDYLKDIFFPYSLERKETEYIFSKSDSRPLDPRTMQYRYKRYLSKAGVSYRKFHTLRHTFASRCLMKGMDVKTLSEILGHADVKTTLNYYCHTSIEYKREQLSLLIPFSQK